MSERWYVYRINVLGRLAYIGKGSGRRFLTSAIRHSGIAGIIEYFRRERDALKREIQLIAALRPPLNKSKGGEGKSIKPIARVYDHTSRERAAAYKKADATKGCLSILIAASYARLELNSAGIKCEADVDLARADPRVVEAVKRVTAWKQLQPVAYRLWNTYFESCGMTTRIKLPA